MAKARQKYLLAREPRAIHAAESRPLTELRQANQWMFACADVCCVYATYVHPSLLSRFHEWPIFTSSDFRFTQNSNALFAMAMAWSTDGGFVIKSWNSTKGDGKRISSVSLVGSTQKVSYKLQPDGMRK